MQWIRLSGNAVSHQRLDDSDAVRHSFRRVPYERGVRRQSVFHQPHRQYLSARINGAHLDEFGYGQSQARGKVGVSSEYGRYGKKIDEITRNGQLNLLRVFCAQKTDEMREKTETATLTRVGIDRAVYADLKALTVAELKEKGYLKKQIRAVRRVAEGRVKVRPIELLELLTDSKGKGDYDVHYDERADKAARTGFRVLKSVVMGAWFALAAPALSQDILNIEVWALFCFQLFTIAWTAWSAEREGYGQIAEVKNKVILRRISFLDEFNEWVKVPKLGEGKGEGEQTREE